MPLIGALPAAAGVSIQDATGQVIRMLSAGAASADLFRERGILAMLGFTSGVAYSADETRRKLVEAWTDMNSKFRGATSELSTTWQGVMSMLSDKWFAFRNQVMDAGLFDYLKAMARTFDQDVGNAMENNKSQAKAWADATINALEGVIKMSALLLDLWTKLEIGIKLIILGLGHVQFLKQQIIGAGAVAESGDLASTLDNLKAEIEGLIAKPGFDANAYIASIRANLGKGGASGAPGVPNVDQLLNPANMSGTLSNEEIRLLKERENALAKYLEQQTKADAVYRKSAQSLELENRIMQATLDGHSELAKELEIEKDVRAALLSFGDDLNRMDAEAVELIGQQIRARHELTDKIAKQTEAQRLLAQKNKKARKE